jgi:Fur family transcriptional regulator, stress-responsive regulator
VESLAGDFETELRAVGLRVTGPRLAVLAALQSHPHIDTANVVGLVRARLPRTSRQTIYDILEAFTATGLVRRIQPAGTTARYEARVGDNHHHAVCRSCGTIVDVECAVGHSPCLDASGHHGFLIDEAEVVYWGTCSDCAAVSAS